MTGFSSLLLAAVVWQIGAKDGSNREFLYRYNAWEYGSAPALRAHAKFNPKTHVWRHVIAENRAYEAADIPEGLSPIYEAEFMHPDEVLCGLELVWNETAPGLRRLTVDIERYANWCAIADDGLEIVAEDGRRKTFALPTSRAKERPSLPALTLTFRVRAGENRVLVNDRSKAKHYKIWFDALTLESVDRDDPPAPFLETRVTAFSGIVHPGEPATLAVRAFNATEGVLAWSVRDVSGRAVARGAGALTAGAAEIALPSATRGWFEVTTRLAGAKPATTSYVVTEPVQLESLSESRFGCHAIESDGYRLQFDNSFRDEFYETAARRAWLGGAKWARLHSISWALREPTKGAYVLDDLDRRFARVEKYKMNILLTTGGTPAWTSTSTSKKLNCCGAYEYLYYPPRDWAAWGAFMAAVVRRYGSRISHYEIGNEPGYASAFWTCGDAPAFGKYLRIAYDAIKGVKPDAVVYPGAPLTVDFLDEATRASGGKPAFDVLSAHYLGNLRRNAEKPLRWKGLLGKYGLPQTYVNSEDMSWSGVGKARGDAAGAAALVRSHVRDAATGATRTFAFCSFGDLSDSYSFFTVRDEPKAFFAAYRAMTHRLERGVYLGSLSGAEYEAYVFDRKGKPVTVIWREEPGRMRLDLGATRVEAVDYMDVARAVTSADGVYEFAVGPEPVYVEGGDLAYLRDQVEARAAIPERVELRPGESRTIRWRDDALTLAAPKECADGLYDRAFVATVRGRRLSYPVLMEVLSPGRGVNRVANGDFERGSAYWFFPKDTNRFAVVSGAGYGGSAGVRTRGVCHFGMAGAVKVRPGETYVVACRARGEGMLGACLSRSDAAHRSLDARPGINLLSARVTPDWRRYSEIVRCNEPNIAYLKLAFLPNYGDNEGRRTLDIDDVVVARLTERVSVEKALNEGAFAATLDAAPAMAISGNGISATCRLALDARALTLRFDVRDDCRVAPVADNHFKSYFADSVQFSIDPPGDGRDLTAFMLGRDEKGRDFLYKSVNYTTPELPDNVTRSGDIAAAKIVREERADGYAVTVAVPLNEVYPLRADATEFGFGWLVNDNDSRGRAYAEWASGIGSGTAPAKLGVVKRRPQ